MVSSKSEASGSATSDGDVERSASGGSRDSDSDGPGDSGSGGSGGRAVGDVDDAAPDDGVASTTVTGSGVDSHDGGGSDRYDFTLSMCTVNGFAFRLF